MVLLIPLDLSAFGGDFCFSKASALLRSFILSLAKAPISKFFCSSGTLFYLKTSFSSSCFLCKSKVIIRIRKNRKLMRTRRKIFLAKDRRNERGYFSLNRRTNKTAYVYDLLPSLSTKWPLQSPASKQTGKFLFPAAQIFRLLHAKTPASSFRAYRRLVWRPRRDSNARPFA